MSEGVNNEKFGVTQLLRKETHNVNMDAVKLAHWQCKLLERSNGVVEDLGMQTGTAGCYPSSDSSVDAMAHKVLHDEPLYGHNSWMTQVVDSVKKTTP